MKSIKKEKVGTGVTENFELAKNSIWGGSSDPPGPVSRAKS